MISLSSQIYNIKFWNILVNIYNYFVVIVENLLLKNLTYVAFVDAVCII